MADVLGIVAAAFVVLLAVGVLRGRVSLRSCCSLADPRHDARMRGAFLDEAVGPEPDTPPPTTARSPTRPRAG